MQKNAALCEKRGEENEEDEEDEEKRREFN